MLVTKIFSSLLSFSQGVSSACQTKLLVTGDLNYETATSYDVIIRVTDQDGLSGVERFTIELVDANDRPSVRMRKRIRVFDTLATKL